MAQEIKVLHIIKTLSLGGAETNLLNLAQAFSSDKVETHIAYSFGGEIEQRFRDARLRLFKYADGNHKIKSLHSVPIILRLARYIRKHQIDIIHTHNFNAHIWGLIAGKVSGAKIVEHVHDGRYTPPAHLAARHSLLDQYKFIKYFKKQSDRVIVLTRDNLQYVVDNGFSAASNVVELQNGIPMDEETPARSRREVHEQFGVPQDAVVILTSARMHASKNIELILRIAPKVKERAPAAAFLIAGDGPNLEEYKARTRALSRHSYVRFIGFHENMYELLEASDIFVLPSFVELHSIAILEALKMKLPVVVSEAVGCNNEFIQNGTNGFLCDPFKNEPWVESLVRLVNDAALRRAMGLNGHHTCFQRFNIHTAATNVEKLYTDLVHTDDKVLRPSTQHGTHRDACPVVESHIASFPRNHPGTRGIMESNVKH